MTKADVVVWEVRELLRREIRRAIPAEAAIDAIMGKLYPLLKAAAEMREAYHSDRPLRNMFAAMDAWDLALQDVGKR